MSRIGPKEAQIRALREARANEREQLAKRRPPDCDRVVGLTKDMPQEVLDAFMSAEVPPHPLDGEDLDVVKPAVAELQAAADAIPAKKIGRPKSADPEARKAAARERMRIKRAEEKKP